ncbi:MAG TPA: phosphatase domain-containing protein [Steroidobacteraceae bacterium]|nr:phosphatase domain-containing protein [Steroidobacteraceae bacterium]
MLYPAYVVGGAGAIEGRVIGYEEERPPSMTEGRRRNLQRNLGLLVNDERANVPVTVRLIDRQWQASTDEEGYFRVELDQLAALTSGWYQIAGEVPGSTTETGLLVVPDSNVHGLISDLDDTILVTEVTSRRRMLANTLLRNPMQREAVPGAAALYRELAARNADVAAAPVFYLSASPRQLHFAIETFLAYNGFPRGVLITKRVTNDETSEPLRDQAAYKKTRIEDILARVPHARFTLIGDDGEHDPEIYDEIRRLHPDRIEAIWIRRVKPESARPKLDGQGDLAVLLEGHCCMPQD